MKFKTMDWIRKVRDKQYEETKGLEPEGKIGHAKQRAQEFKAKHPKTSVPDK